MKLAKLSPVQNCVINGYSLVDNIFGANFVVYDAMGSMLTTTKNSRLLHRAQELVENLHLYDAIGLSNALENLRDEADVLLQSEYEHSVWRERQFAEISDNNYSIMAGSFE